MTLFEEYFQLLMEVKQVLNKAEIPFWLDFGTLLGFYRQGEFLKNDPDIDLGVKREDQEKLMAVLPELKKIGKVEARVEKGNGHYLAGYKIHRNNFWIDIAFYFKHEDKRIWTVSQWEQVMVFDEKYFNELQDLEVKGIVFQIPNHIEELMILKYGEDWKRPFEEGEEYDLHLRPNIDNKQNYLECLK